jgi:hypothetical protein
MNVHPLRREGNRARQCIAGFLQYQKLCLREPGSYHAPGSFSFKLEILHIIDRTHHEVPNAGVLCSACELKPHLAIIEQERRLFAQPKCPQRSKQHWRRPSSEDRAGHSGAG